MPFDVLQAHSLGRVAIQNATNEIYDLWTEIDGELDLNFEDFIIGLILVGTGLERRLPCT